jgi:hypothetical protein
LSIRVQTVYPFENLAEPLGGGRRTRAPAADESAVPTVRNPISTALCIALVGTIAALFFLSLPQRQAKHSGRPTNLPHQPARERLLRVAG